MQATQEMYEAAAIVAAGSDNWDMSGESERGYYVNEVRPVIDAALAAAPQQDLDPSHAALEAQVDRLRKAIRQADVDQQWQTHAWFGSGEFAYSGSDDDIVTNSEHLQPGDLGEGGA